MTRQTRLCLFSCIIWLAALFLSGCISSSLITPKDLGTITVTTTGIPERIESNWTAHIIFSRGKHELSQTIEVVGTDFSSEIKIPVGTWNISMYLVDDNDIVNYQDSLKDITIYPDKPVFINFQLSPAEGLVQVIIEIDNFPQAEQVLRARVHFNDEIKEIIRDTPLEPLKAQYSIPPGSYDFKVELFTESFRVGDKIDPGIWQTIHIEPLSEQTLVWSPFMQDLYISVDIFMVPPAPTNLTALYSENRVCITWDINSFESLVGHNIYWQISPFEPFELITHVDASITEFTHDLTDLEELPAIINYTVASFSAKVTGYRAQPVIVSLD